MTVVKTRQKKKTKKGRQPMRVSEKNGRGPKGGKGRE